VGDQVRFLFYHQCVFLNLMSLERIAANES
jgi:hypothetical protein